MPLPTLTRPHASRLPSAGWQRWLWGAALAATLGGASAQAPAQSTAQILPSEEITQMARQAAQSAGLQGARIEVQLGELDPRLNLAPCQKVEPFLPTGVPALGRTRVGLRCAAGPKLWSVTLPVTVQVWSTALVTTEALPAGTVLTAQHLMPAEVDLTAAPGAAITVEADAIGRSLNRSLAPGSALRATDLKARQWFAAGEMVRVSAIGPGWQVVVEGQAMNPGIEGQPVRVRTESGRMITGRPVADRWVEMRL
jgi:flagella basal body P-ring formation protein FlgA